MAKINKEWHQKNKMPKKASLNERIQWHTDHNRECSCRPIPPKIQLEMIKRKPKVIVGVLVRNKNKFLLVRETLEGGKDYWIIPGGKVEFGETLEIAAKREILEETGIVAKELSFLVFREAIAPKYNYHGVIFFFETISETTETRDDVESKVIEAKWFTREEVLKLPLVFSAKELFEDVIK
ncbi:MAG: NUDIX hydrolase [Microgenomates group bacterium]